MIMLDLSAINGLTARIDPETFMTVSRQAELFLLSVPLGAAMGILLDAFRALRAAFPPAAKAFPTAVCDMVWLILCGLGLYAFSVWTGDGMVRGYYCLGAAIGAVLYLLTAGNLMIGLIRRFFGAVYGFLGKIAALFRKIGAKTKSKFVTNAKKSLPKGKSLKKHLKDQGK